MYRCQLLCHNPSKHFSVFSTLFLGWYDVATSHNAKLALKQRCVRQRWNLKSWTTSVVHFNVDLNNVRQHRNNVVIFNVDFHNVWQRWNNVVNTSIWKKKIKPRFKNKIIFLSFKEHVGLKIFFILFSILYLKEDLRGCKILKTWNILNYKNYICTISFCKMSTSF